MDETISIQPPMSSHDGIAPKTDVELYSAEKALEEEKVRQVPKKEAEERTEVLNGYN